MTEERLCITCAVLFPARPKPHHYERDYVCESCRRKVAVTLAEIPRLCRELPAAFPRKRRPQINGSRVRSTPQPSEPINWTPYDLSLPADPGTRALMARGALGIDPDQIGDLSVATVLDTWVRDWAQIRTEHLPVPTVRVLCRWLSFRWEWACSDHPAVDEFANELVDLAWAARSALGLNGSAGANVGQCPAVLRDGSRCGRTLRVDMYGVDESGMQRGLIVISCRCGSSWDRSKPTGNNWVNLAAAQEAAGLARWQEKTSA